jgi:hypothetical protein
MKREWCGSHVGGCNPGNRGNPCSPLGRCAGCVDRAPAELYQAGDFPNFRFVRLELKQKTVVDEMIRLGSAGEDDRDASVIRNALLHDTDDDGHERYLPNH